MRGKDEFRPSASAHAVQPARRGQQDRAPHAAHRQGWHARGRDHRPREHVRRDRLLPLRGQPGGQADHRLRGVRGAQEPLRQTGVRRRRPGARRQLPSHPARHESGGLPQPVPAGDGRFYRGLLPQAARGPRPLARTQPRHHRAVGLPERRVGARHAARRRQAGARRGRSIRGDLRRPLLRRNPGQPPAPAGKDQSRAHRARTRDVVAAGRHQRLPLSEPGGRRGARSPLVRAECQGDVRRKTLEVRHRPTVRQDAAGNGRRVRPLPAGRRRHPGRGRAVHAGTVLRQQLLLSRLRRRARPDPRRVSGSDCARRP